jgi:hypothetical protein
MINTLIRLPIEVILEIRGFLCPNEPRFTTLAFSYDDFILKENCWSWRNFLSVSNREEWRSLRKDAMIWSLNKFESKKYIDDDSFRPSMDNRVTGSKQKIQLFLPNVDEYSLTQLKSSLDTSYIGFISILNYKLAEFPSCRSVEILILHSLREIKKLGSYENLKMLELRGWSTLESIGDMRKLSFLSLNSLKSCLFPLEQLLSFQLLNDQGEFEQQRNRFLLLEDLQLSNGNSFSLPAHGIALKNLKSLSLTEYETANFSGLRHLKSLTLLKVTTLLGAEEIFPQLTKLQGDSYFLREGIEKFPQLNEFVDHSVSADLPVEQFKQCWKIPVVHVSVLGDNIRTLMEDCVVGEKVRSLQIRNVNFRSFQGVQPGRYFDEFRLSSCVSLQDVSMFRNTQKVYLFQCSSITDISSLRDVPYLGVMRCQNIKDYSCLGSQHYLEIGYASYLTDDNINSFGSIRCLKIYNCPRIATINRLAHNRFLEIGFCGSLSSVVFTGFDYVKVSLTYCPKLASVSIPGWVYSLNVHSCAPSLNQNSLANYSDLEFKY